MRTERSEIAKGRSLCPKGSAGGHWQSTGHYHRALVAAAHAAGVAGVALTVANPQQVRGFARGLGRRAKTDPMDAQTLADFGRVTLPKADLAPSAAQTALQELVGARQQAVLERSTVKVQAAGHQLALVKALTRARLKVLSAQIAKLEAASAKTLAAEEHLAAQAARLVAVRGVGALTAATARTLCPELGTLTRGGGRRAFGRRPFRSRQRPVQGPAPPRRRALPPALRALHGRLERRPRQLRPPHLLPAPARRRQTRQTRPHRRHA